MDAWELVMRALALYAGVSRDDNLKAQALSKNHGRRSEIPAGRREFCRQQHVQRPYGLGRHGDNSPHRRTRRSPLSAPTGRTLGRTMRGHRLPVYEAFRRLACRVQWALSLNQFSLPRAITGSPFRLRPMEEGGIAARRAMRLSPRDPFSAICGATATW
jgi:hypothetical protein